MSYSAATLRAVQTGIDLAIPYEMSTSEWAEDRRGVGRGNRQGKWLNSTAPFLVEIMNCADDPYVRRITMQASRQIGKTSCGENIIGKRIDIAPTEIAYVGEKEDKARAWTQEAFDSMVRETPALQSRISRTPDGNNQNVKKYSGGSLHILWATSPAEASSRPYQIIILDEKAAYQATREGDIVTILEGSTNTYDGEELIIILSTPRRCFCGPGETCMDVSHDYEAGDQRQYYVPCPHCDEFQTLKFGGKDTPFGLKWDPDTPELPYYICEHCQCVIEEFDRDDMLPKGYWKAAQEFNGVASFKINQIYSPFVSWGTMVTDFIEAQGNIGKVEVFTNTVLGEVWKPVERIDYEMLAMNVEQYDAEVPTGVLVLTAGVDVQKNRLECEIVGWGMGNESWSIGYRVFEGDTGAELSEDDDPDELSSVWADLEEYLASSFVGPGGQVFRVQCAAIDSGYNTQRVAQFCKRHERKRWFAVKGMSDPFKALLSKPSKTGKNPVVRMFPIGTNAAKDEVYSSLRVTKPGPGYCHFPDLPHYDDAHWKQLCSERMVTHTRGGRTYRTYEKVGANVSNEALDIRCYAMVARMILNPNYERIAKRVLQHPEAADRASDEGRVTSDEQPDPPTPKPTGTDNVVRFRTKARNLNRNNGFH